MRLAIATRDGLHVVRWIRGERSGRILAAVLGGEDVTAVGRGRAGVYAVSRRSGLHRSADRGASWSRVSEAPTGYAGVALTMAEGSPDLLHLGTEPAALFRSSDGGASWEEVRAFRAIGDLPGEEWTGYGTRAPHVQTVVRDPHAGSRLYAGVEIGGAYRSDDAGASWEPINEGLYDDIHRLAADPRDGSRLYAATGGGLHLSRDRGGAWTRVEGEPGSAYCTDLLVPAARGRTTLYVATAEGFPSTWAGVGGGAKARLWASRDAGETWAPADDGPRLRGRAGYAALADDPEREDTIFVATGDGSVYYVEEDAGGGGSRWSKILFGLPPVAAMVVL